MGLSNVAKSIKRAVTVMRAIARHPLHRTHPIRAVTHAVRLVIASKLTPTHQIAVPYVGDAILHWPIEATSVMLCARFGLGEYADMAFCLHLLRQDDLFCDVGANAGVYTILAARAVGCEVVAAEPIPRTFDLLMQNVYANGVAGKVDARCNGVGQQHGWLNFTSSLWSLNHVVESATDDSVKVEVLTLDSILAGRVPRVMKIDVEGFEFNVLKGASATLSNPGLEAILIEMTDNIREYEGSQEEVASLLLGAGFSGPYWYDPDKRSLVPAGRGAPTKYNQLFVRDVATAEARLKQARLYEIHHTQI